MRKVTEFDPFCKEESLIHKLSESNSEYIALSAPYLDPPPSPLGEERAAFKVGQKVTDNKVKGRSFYRTPMIWKVLDVYKIGGFVKYVCQLDLTPKLKKEKWPATKTTFNQTDLNLASWPTFERSLSNLKPTTSPVGFLLDIKEPHNSVQH